LATNAAESATVSRSGYSVGSLTRMAARPRMIITNRKREIDTFPKLVSLNTDQSASQSSTPLSVPAILATTHANQKPPLSSQANPPADTASRSRRVPGAGGPPVHPE